MQEENRAVLIDADFLSSFLKIGRLALIKDFFRVEKLYIPVAVFSELAKTNLVKDLLDEKYVQIEKIDETSFESINNRRCRFHGLQSNLQRLKENGIELIHRDIRNKEDLEGTDKADIIIECSAEPLTAAIHISSFIFLTSSLALNSDSKVPASLQYPFNCEKSISPMRIYSLFTSVISSSPLPEGLRFCIISNTLES